MPIVNDDGVYDNELEAVLNLVPDPLRRVYINAKDEATQTASSENNASAASETPSAQASGGVEDRRGEPNPNEPKWENLLPSIKELAKVAGHNLGIPGLAIPLADEVTPTELSKSAGYDQIRIEKAVPSQSLLDRTIDDLLQGTQFFASIYQAVTGKERTYHTSDTPFSQVEFSKGLLNRDAPIGNTKLAREVENFQARASDPIDNNITSEDIDTAINVGMGAGPGIVAGQASVMPPGMAAKLGKAMSAKAFKESDEKIMKETGWWKGGDDKWKYEISDEGMKLVDKDWRFGDKGKLGEFIEHPELFKAYPELKDINFEVGRKSDKYVASFNPDKKLIKINPSAVQAGDEGILDILIHEIQHAIQMKEGFAPGSNPEHAGNQMLSALAEKIYSLPPGKVKNELQDLYFELRTKRKDLEHYMYLRSPGEIEANMVSARRKLSEGLRKEFPLKEHQKMIEGETDNVYGNQYLPEFWYPQ